MTNGNQKRKKTHISTLLERIEKLPELPVELFEADGKLNYSDKVPLITVRPGKFSPSKKPLTPTKLVKYRPSWTINFYALTVTYPKVVCQPPIVDPTVDQINSEALFEQKDVGGSSELESDLEIISKKERFYKLTGLKDRKFQSPWWCSVKFGPWTAFVTEEINCNTAIPTYWTLTIGEIPEFILTWYGTWDDIPPHPSLRLFPVLPLTFFKQKTGCCPGYMYCIDSQSCKLKCPDPVIPV
ncbi:MAG TPA: hypothetical protein VLD84_00195 [Nitrososphaeraceae archaeon]|nr:hypothetical protein [Nitrososphaeraceae archaeon]